MGKIIGKEKRLSLLETADNKFLRFLHKDIYNGLCSI